MLLKPLTLVFLKRFHYCGAGSLLPQSRSWFQRRQFSVGLGADIVRLCRAGGLILNSTPNSILHLEIWKEVSCRLSDCCCFTTFADWNPVQPMPRAVEMWPPVKEFPTGGRSRKFPADNAEPMQIAFALFANIKLAFYSILGRTRIRPGRENWPSSPFIRADLCTEQGAHKNPPNLGSNTVWAAATPPVCHYVARNNAAMCGGGGGNFTPYLGLFCSTGEQFPVYSLNEGGQ